MSKLTHEQRITRLEEGLQKLQSETLVMLGSGVVIGRPPEYRDPLHILGVVSEVSHVAIWDIKSESRIAVFVSARRVSVQLLKNYSVLDFLQIGELMKHSREAVQKLAKDELSKKEQYVYAKALELLSIHEQ